MRRFVLVGLVGLFSAMTVGVTSAPVGAAEFGPITDVATLRDVIEDQATEPTGDTVILGAGITFTLTCADGGLIHDPATPLTIVGNGSILELEPGCDDTVLTHADVAGDESRILRLESFTIRGGDITSGGDGGGLASSTDIELAGMTFTDNHVSFGSSSGGAFSTLGGATITDSVFTGNTSTGPGGAIRLQGELTMERSTVSGNTGGLSGGGDVGGGISVSGPSTISTSTISGNSAGEGDNGGGISFDETLTLVNSTVTGNTAGDGGGGVSGDEEDSALTLVYTTVVGNTAAAAANVQVGSLASFGSVVAQPQGGGTSCGILTPTTSNGYNVDDDGSCGFGAGPGDRSAFTGALLLGPLADNGGPTQTLLPALSSPLVGTIPDAACQDDGAVGITADQRSLPRPAPDLVGCDVGAVEVQAPPIVLRFTG